MASSVPDQPESEKRAPERPERSESSQAPASESVAEKLSREAHVIGRGLVEGFVHGAQKKFDEGWSAVAEGGLAVGLGVGLGLVGKAPGAVGGAARALGAAMTIGFARDLASPERLGNIGSALSGAWESPANTAQSIKLLRDNAGEFAFDTTVGFALTGAGVGIGAKLRSLSSLSTVIPEIGRTTDVIAGSSTRVDLGRTPQFEPMTLNAVRLPKTAEVVGPNGEKLESSTLIPDVLKGLPRPLLTDETVARDLAVRLKPQFEAMANDQMESRFDIARKAQERINWNDTHTRAQLEGLLPEHIKQKMEPEENFTRRSFMRETLKDHPEALKIWETGFNQRIADQTVVDRFDRRLGTHMRHLERGANEFLESKGLARVKLEAANPEDLNGAIAVYGGSTHVVRLSLPRLVSELYEDQVVGHIGHELTHHEQLTLVSRLWMDIAGVGKTLSPAQRAQVREIGERAVKRAPTDEFFDQVAAHRAGNPLSESESKRALVLEDSWRTLKSGANPKLELTRDRIKEAQTQLLTRGAFQQIQMFNVFDKVGLLKAHSKKMFGVEEPPEEVRQLMAMAKGVKGNTPPPDWNEPQASRIIEGILSERLQGVDAKLQHELKVYREQPHEVEAYAAQHVVERQADIAGYGEEYDFLKKYRGADAATDRLLRALFSVKDE